MDDYQWKTSKKFVFPTNTCSVHSLPLTQSQISKDAKTTWSSNGEPHTSHFPNFPFACKAPSRVHGKFLHADTAACHICFRLLAESVRKDTKLHSSRDRALSFSKSNCQELIHTSQPKLQHTLQNWSLKTKPKQTWGTHTNRSRLSSLFCDPLRPAITLQIRSYSRGIVLCQCTPSPSIPPVPAAPCNNKPPCSHATGLECLTGVQCYKTLSFAL